MSITAKVLLFITICSFGTAGVIMYNKSKTKESHKRVQTVLSFVSDT